MSAFATALRAFQADRLTRDQVLSEIYRSLAVDRATPAQLRTELDISHLAEALPADFHRLIVERLASWDQTITSPASYIQTLQPIAKRPNILVAVGAVLQGRYRLIEIIGIGGMSRVFKAVDLRRVEAGSTDPHIAIKVLMVPFSHFSGSTAILQSEAQKLQRLTHQNIVRVMDCDRDGETVFMSMELLSGQSIYARLMRSEVPIPADEAQRIVSGVADGLEFAHRHHIVHGDLKPGNVIVTETGDIKVIDFGMARFIGEQPADGMNPPSAMTPRYASPQLLAGEAPTQADDIYALACLAHEILTGIHPFAAHLASGAPLSEKLRLERSPRLNPRQFKAIAHALAFDRGERTQSVREFVAEFAAAGSAAGRWRTLGLVAAIIAVLFAGMYWLRTRSSVAPLPQISVKVVVPPAPGTVFRDCPMCPLMTVVAGGKFAQGAAPNDPAATAFERPQHQVILAHALAIGQNEVTISEFKQFVDDIGAAAVGAGCQIYDGAWHRKDDADWKSPGYATISQDPVSCVSWREAAAYAAWLSKSTGKTYRLPSASEWEYAARAGSAAARPWSTDADTCRYANIADQSASERYPGWQTFGCNDGFVAVAPVGSFKANAFGLNDMLGNVFEWTQDCWRDDYVGAPTDGSARADAACQERELRGGSWFTTPRAVSASYRNRFAEDYRSSSVGFRIVREVDP